MRTCMLLTLGMTLIPAHSQAKGILYEEAYSIGVTMVAAGECMDMVATKAADILSEVVFSFAKDDQRLSDFVNRGGDDFSEKIRTEGRIRACADAIEDYPDLLKIEPARE